VIRLKRTKKPYNMVKPRLSFDYQKLTIKDLKTKPNIY